MISSVSEARREQALKNLERINERRRTATHCQRGHSNWGIRTEDGRTKRFCIDCKNDRRPKAVVVLGPLGLRAEEIDVLQAAADGLSVAEAAKKLSYCRASICDQRARAFKKLGVNSIAHAIAEGFRHGIIN